MAYKGVGIYRLSRGGWCVAVGQNVISKHRSMREAANNAIKVAAKRQGAVSDADNKKAPPGKPGGA